MTPLALLKLRFSDISIAVINGLPGVTRDRGAVGKVSARRKKRCIRLQTPVVCRDSARYQAGRKIVYRVFQQPHWFVY